MILFLVKQKNVCNVCISDVYVSTSDVCVCVYTCVEKWCMTAIEMQASKEAVRKGRLRASDTNAWKPLSAQIWTRALLRSQPTWWETTQHICLFHRCIILKQKHTKMNKHNVKTRPRTEYRGKIIIFHFT